MLWLGSYSRCRGNIQSSESSPTQNTEWWSKRSLGLEPQLCPLQLSDPALWCLPLKDGHES
jgi:hypothetical protein